MERDIPDWQSFDPDGPDAQDVAVLGDEGTPFVALLSTEAARRGGWAARAAVALARTWGAARGRLLLADLDLRAPALHGALGVENGEGMSDVFLYGASVQRVARPVDPGFLFAPAGTVVADPARVLGSPRWDVVVEGFARAGATLVVHVPLEADGTNGLVERSTDVVLLAGFEERDVLEVPDAWKGRVRAVLGTEAEIAAPEAATRREGEEADVELADPPSSAPGEGSPGELPSGEPRPIPRPRPRHGDRPSGRERTGGRRRLGLLLLLLLVVLLAVVVAAWFGLVEVPGVPAGGVADAAPAVEATPPGTPPTAVPRRPVLSYSLALASYEDVEVAHRRARALAERRGDLLFVVVPVEVAGIVYHRLLAGPVLDSAGTSELRTSLAQTLTGEDPESWIARPTPLAFHFGRFATREEATARVRELAGAGIDAYVLEEPPTAGGGFHVYAGAFADAREASYMRGLLDARGLGVTPLEPRTGRIPDTTA